MSNRKVDGGVVQYVDVINGHLVAEVKPGGILTIILPSGTQLELEIVSDTASLVCKAKNPSEDQQVWLEDINEHLQWEHIWPPQLIGSRVCSTAGRARGLEVYTCADTSCPVHGERNKQWEKEAAEAAAEQDNERQCEPGMWYCG